MSKHVDIGLESHLVGMKRIDAIFSEDILRKSWKLAIHLQNIECFHNSIGNIYQSAIQTFKSHQWYISRCLLHRPYTIAQYSTTNNISISRTRESTFRSNRRCGIFVRDSIWKRPKRNQKVHSPTNIHHALTNSAVVEYTGSQEEIIVWPDEPWQRSSVWACQNKSKQKGKKRRK